MNWSKMIRTLRSKLLLTQAEFAELLKVSFATINRWENEHYEPSTKIKRKIKEICVENGIDFYSFIEEKMEGIK